MGNPYIHYYLGQQDGRGMPVFKGSSWQRGYGQVGYGLGGLFRSLGKIAKPMIKSGAKALGNIALTSGVNLRQFLCLRSPNIICIKQVITVTYCYFSKNVF